MEMTGIRSDRELLEDYSSGRGSAISELLERYRGRLYSYIRMLLRDGDLADDILQETMVRITRQIDAGGYTDSGKFLPWAMRIAHNLAIDHFRQRGQALHVAESDSGYSILDTARFSEPTAEDDLVRRQTEDAVRRLIDLLPEDQAQVVRMRYYSDMTFKEIAKATDVSINTALGRMRYALINLRKMIAENNLSV